MKFFPFAASLIACFGLGTTAAQAQIPSPTASYSGQMVMTTGQGDYTANVYGAPMKSRTDMYMQGTSMTTVLDLNTRTALSYSTDPDSGMGRVVMRTDYGRIADRYGATIDSTQSASRVGSDTVAGHRCDLYQQDDVTGCVTSDGIVLRVRGNDGYSMEMTQMTRGAQPASYFEVPAGYTVQDMNGMADAFAAAAAASEESYRDEPYREPTYNRRSDAEIVGDAIAGDAGRVIGGLFGKKKKKKR